MIAMVHKNGKDREATAQEAAELAETQSMESPWDIRRQQAYGSIQDQLDMLYWDQMNGTTNWRDHITSVKQSIPKP
jgi:hypothetical protein